MTLPPRRVVYIDKMAQRDDALTLIGHAVFQCCKQSLLTRAKNNHRQRSDRFLFV
jgi:hypothetical protein